MRRLLLALAGLLCLLAPAQAQQQDLLDSALRAAARTFARAAPQLERTSMGVHRAEYGDALSKRQFQSSLWGLPLKVDVAIKQSGGGLCAGFAAYVTPAIAQHAVTLTVCPEFFSPGADTLRETTILHEMVHVVAGTDECRAMAYTAQIQMLATGSFQPVEQYWRANRCESSRFHLPR